MLEFVGVSSKHLRVSLESPWQSSDIFGNFRKFSENVRERSSGLRNNFGESSEIFGKWSRFEILASFTFLCAFRCQSHFGQNELKKASVDISIMLVYSRASGQPERAKWHPCGITRFLPYKSTQFCSFEGKL